MNPDYTDLLNSILSAVSDLQSSVAASGVVLSWLLGALLGHSIIGGNRRV